MDTSPKVIIIGTAMFIVGIIVLIVMLTSGKDKLPKRYENMFLGLSSVMIGLPLLGVLYYFINNNDNTSLAVYEAINTEEIEEMHLNGDYGPFTR